MRSFAIFFLFFITTSVFVPAQEQKTIPHGKLIWSDEFDYHGLPDPAKWGYEEGFIRNREAQYYTVQRKKNARIRKGMLVITARKEKLKNQAYDNESKAWNKSG